MKKIKGLLIDLDGTLYVEGEALPGAVEAINELKKNYSVRFLSNTTSKTKSMVLERMRKIGFDVEENQIFTALEAIKSFLKKENKAAYFLMSNISIAELQFLPDGPPDYVVVAHARDNFIYPNINQAFRYLMQGAKLVAASKTRYFKDKDGDLSLDGGAFTAALEYASGQEAIILGKPSKSFFEQAVNSMDMTFDQVAMVGDDYQFDSLGAMQHGIMGIQVKTGKFKESDLKLGEVDLLVDSISTLPKILQQINYSQQFIV